MPRLRNGRSSMSTSSGTCTSTAREPRTKARSERAHLVVRRGAASQAPEEPVDEAGGARQVIGAMTNGGAEVDEPHPATQQSDGHGAHPEGDGQRGALTASPATPQSPRGWPRQPPRRPTRRGRCGRRRPRFGDPPTRGGACRDLKGPAVGGAASAPRSTASASDGRASRPRSWKSPSARSTSGTSSSAASCTMSLSSWASAPAVGTPSSSSNQIAEADGLSAKTAPVSTLSSTASPPTKAVSMSGCARGGALDRARVRHRSSSSRATEASRSSLRYSTRPGITSTHSAMRRNASRRV